MTKEDLEVQCKLLCEDCKNYPVSMHNFANEPMWLHRLPNDPKNPGLVRQNICKASKLRNLYVKK